MDFLILLILVPVLLETTVLTIKSAQKPLINSGRQRRKVYIDTSVLMDPRLLPVAQTGFLADEIIVPRSVTNELQLLADGKDSEKRTRARSGLETVRELERVVYINMVLLEDPLDHTPVDNRLLELAKANRGAILTNDYNLQKVAETEHVDVLNLNNLALALRNEFVPGEHAHVKIVAAGSGDQQGVGYLRDGTMVVVDEAKDKIGKEIEVEFLRLNQTASGTMMFARTVTERREPTKVKTSVMKATVSRKNVVPRRSSQKPKQKESTRNNKKSR